MTSRYAAARALEQLQNARTRPIARPQPRGPEAQRVLLLRYYRREYGATTAQRRLADARDARRPDATAFTFVEIGGSVNESRLSEGGGSHHRGTARSEEAWSSSCWRETARKLIVFSRTAQAARMRQSFPESPDSPMRYFMAMSGQGSLSALSARGRRDSRRRDEAGAACEYKPLRSDPDQHHRPKNVIDVAIDNALNGLIAIRPTRPSAP